ncbi:serine/threonine protein kinase [Phlyctema vagabunda]|uniref:Serine/threonine protein kinase n=1 Tax=Phlyctema vagabunda TaxID=108571 RepID=A0ABR4P2I3_9HELO
MATPALFHIGQQLRGRLGAYKIVKQVTGLVYIASNAQSQSVVVKTVEDRHWRLHNERDILHRFQHRTPTIRPLVDEIEDPADPPAIVLKYLDDDLTHASKKQRLTRPEIKYVARRVLEALSVLHEDGFVHTDIKPSNILVNYGSGSTRFTDVQLADCGGTVSVDSEFAQDGVLTGSSVFRAPEVHLEISWNTAADIWSFGVTLINLIWALNFHIFEPKLPQGDEMYDVMVVVEQHKFFGPFPVSYKEICDEETQEGICRIIASVELEDMKPFPWIGEREVCKADKEFLLKIMKLDPRDRPSANDLLHDEWFTETSERTVGWYSKEEWAAMQKSA